MANLATPTVSVNDDVIEIQPNSLSFKKGKGDFVLRTQQAGSAVSVIANANVETKLSMVKFTMLMSDVSTELVDQWLLDRENNGSTIDIFDGSISTGFQRMFLISEPEQMTGSDGTIEFEFQGPPAN